MTAPECGFTGCDRQPSKLTMGFCGAHYMQSWRGKELRPLRRPIGVLPDALKAASEATEKCVVCPGGSRDQDGYGLIWYAGKQTRAHRLIYKLLVGPIPDGKVIDHVRSRGCVSRECINPAHLEPVTAAENARRGSLAQRTHCNKGHEFTPANTRIRERGRTCRTCGRDSQRRHRARAAL